MANNDVKAIEAKGVEELQTAITTWIETLNSGYNIEDVSICQAGASLESRNVIATIIFTDGAS